MHYLNLLFGFSSPQFEAHSFYGHITFRNRPEAAVGIYTFTSFVPHIRSNCLSRSWIRCIWIHASIFCLASTSDTDNAFCSFSFSSTPPVMLEVVMKWRLSPLYYNLLPYKHCHRFCCSLVATSGTGCIKLIHA